MSTCVLCGGCGDATFSRATDMSTCVLCGRGWGATF
jgi:ribosomal protein S27E